MRHSSQERGFDFGSIVHARWHAVRQQVHQEGFFTRGRRFDQLDQFSRLLGIQRQWGDAQRCALGYVVTVGFQHIFSPVYQIKKGLFRRHRRPIQKPWRRVKFQAMCCLNLVKVLALISHALAKFAVHQHRLVGQLQPHGTRLCIF